MINNLIKKISYLNREQKSVVERAFAFADEKHKTQKRNSGEPYINHPVRVATYLAENKYDYQVIAASLLHDTIEDTDTTYDDLYQLFGKEIADLVDGVTKISKITIKSKDKVFSDDELFVDQADNYRKLLVATAKDIRVIAIRLNDRLDNIKTVEYLKKHKIKFYARETIEIFAPIADRLGMGEMKGALEDYAFKYAYPEEYEKFIHETKSAYQNPKKVVAMTIPRVKRLLKQNEIDYIDVSGRAKHQYSLYLKLKKKHDIKQIFDIVALRIIVDNIENCYKALGTIHSLYEPLPGRIYDYIARPKDNGYQSLHTTVRDMDDNIFEIQIRTSEMHQFAEYGQASHWNYKDKTVGSGTKTAKSNNEWLQELEKINTVDEKTFIDTVKNELFSKRIFVFTPLGDIIDLPQGSSSIDFAYKIHSKLGDHCVGTKINDRLMPLNTKLETKDIVEIITNPKSSPKRNWLQFVKTSHAKNKIKSYLNSIDKESCYKKGLEIFLSFLKENQQTEIEKIAADKAISRSRLPYKDYKSALSAIGENAISKSALYKILYPSKRVPVKKSSATKRKITEISELHNIRHAYAGCCKPKSCDKKVGYITKDHIVKIHKSNCARIEKADKRRLLDLSDQHLI